MMNPPPRPAASSIADVLAVLELAKDAQAVKSVCVAIKADIDGLALQIAANSALIADIQKRESALTKRESEVTEKEAQASSTAEKANAMKTEYDAKLATLKNLLR